MSDIKKALRKLAGTVICLCAGTAFSWGIVSGLLNHIFHGADYGEMLLYSFLTLLVLSVVFYNKYTAAVVCAVAVMAALLFLFNIRTSPELRDVVSEISAFINDVALYISGFESYDPVYEAAISVALCISVAVFTFLFRKARVGLYALTALAVGVYIVILSTGPLLSALPFVICVFGLLVLTARTLNAKNMISYRPVGAGITAAALLCAGIAWAVPAPPGGLVSSFVEASIRRPFNAAHRYISSFFTPKYFTLSTSGYLRNDRILGGDVAPTDDVVMTLVSNHVRPLYLAGAFMDKYTGESWENTLSERAAFSFDEPNTALLERMFSNLSVSLVSGEFLLFAMAMEDPSVLAETWYLDRTITVTVSGTPPFTTLEIPVIPPPPQFPEGSTLTIQMQPHLYRRHTAEITMLNARTFTVFTTGMSVGAAKEGIPIPLLKDGGDNLMSARIIERNSPYTVEYRIDPSLPIFADIKRFSRQGM